MSQTDLAILCGTTQNTISSIECGTFVPRLALAMRLSIVLETSIENLFKDTYAVCCINVESVKERLKEENENVNC